MTNMKRILLLLLLFFSISLLDIQVQAHPGGTDSSGCHTCRTNCAQYGLRTGQYHCHTPRTSVPRITTPTTPRTPTSPSTTPSPSLPRITPPTNTSPTSPSTQTTSSSDNYDFIVMIMALGIIGVIVIVAINNGSSKRLDNSKLTKGMEDIRDKLKDM